MDDFAAEARRRLHTDHGISPDEIEGFYYLRRNPILCGLMIFRFSLTLNEIGLGTANQWGAVIAVAHLYNALRHEMNDFPQWMDMEALMLIHTTQRIFWRDVPPSEARQYSLAYERATGVSEFSSNGNGMRVPKKMEQRGLAQASIVSWQYHNRFCFAHDKPIRTLPEIEKILNSTADDEVEKVLKGIQLLGPVMPESSASESATDLLHGTKFDLPLVQYSDRSLTAQFQKTHALTNIQLLQALCTRTAQESYTLNFDYFSFHMRCLDLLKDIYHEFEEEVDELNGVKLECEYGELPVAPRWIFQMMEDEEKRKDVVARLATVVEEVVREEGSKEVITLKQFLDSRVAQQQKLE